MFSVLFDYTFFPLWSAKKYDSFGLIDGSVDFVRFFLNQLDSNIGKIDPIFDLIITEIFDLLGGVPVIGDIMDIVYDLVEPMGDWIGDSILPWIDVYINIINKDFETGFARFATTIPNYTKMNSAFKTTENMVELVMPLIKQGISGGDHNIMWDPSDDWDINHIVKQIATLKG